MMRSVELVLKLFVLCGLIPWMIGIVIAAATVEPLVENFVMVFGFLMVTGTVGLAILSVAVVLEFIRKGGE